MGFMGESVGQLKALANSGLFTSEPITLRGGGGHS